MLARQGGRTYHGGTSASNAPMRALFTRHGCEVHAHLVEMHVVL